MAAPVENICFDAKKNPTYFQLDVFSFKHHQLKHRP